MAENGGGYALKCHLALSRNRPELQRRVLAMLNHVLLNGGWSCAVWASIDATRHGIGMSSRHGSVVGE